jgi:hypothetical protein
VTRAPSISRALLVALKTAEHEPVDAAAVALAKAYAARLDDDPDALLKIGHMMLPVLTALGMTPAARRATAPKGATPDAPVVRPLDQLRDRRRSRADRAAAVDASAIH